MFVLFGSEQIELTICSDRAAAKNPTKSGRGMALGSHFKLWAELGFAWDAINWPGQKARRGLAALSTRVVIRVYNHAGRTTSRQPGNSVAKFQYSFLFFEHLTPHPLLSTDQDISILNYSKEGFDQLNFSFVDSESKCILLQSIFCLA